MLFSSELNEEQSNIFNKTNYKKIEISNLLIDQKKTLDKFCNKYNKIFTTGEIKDLERRWGTNWCKFNLFSGKNKLSCITRIYNADLVNNKLYELYGNISNGNYGLQFNVESMDLVKNKLSPFEELYYESKKRNYFVNKKDVNLCNINNIIILSKKDTQGCSDFIEHMKIPLNISIKSVTLEGENTSKDIINSIKGINKSFIEGNLNCDLIIILRGGGNTSDISKSFDKIELFEAIRNSNIPIGTAIGHTKDVKDKLLITSISDINFDTPSVAASLITDHCKKYFYNLREEYRNEFNKLIDNNIDNIDNFFNDLMEKKSEKIELKVESLKEQLVKSILDHPIVELGKNEDIIYVPHGNKFKRCKVSVEGYIDINPKDIELIMEIEDVKDIKKIVKKVNSVNMDLKILKELEKYLKENEKIEVSINKYNDLKGKRNSLYLKKIPKLSLSNIYKIKEILLYNKDYINICENEKIDINEFGNNEYNILKEKVKITEEKDIFNMLRYLNYIINL